VTPQSGVTPLTINVAVPDPESAALSQTPPTGTITVSGPSNSVQIPVVFDTSVALNFSAETGTVPPFQTIGFALDYSPLNFAITKTNGGAWLTAVPANPAPTYGPVLHVYADPAGLATGTYTGAITITPPASAGVSQPVIYPISLTVWDESMTPTITVSPAQISFSSSTASPRPCSTVPQPRPTSWFLMKSRGAARSRFKSMGTVTSRHNGRFPLCCPARRSLHSPARELAARRFSTRTDRTIHLRTRPQAAALFRFLRLARER